MKAKSKALLVSLMTIALCVSLIAGSTYALFTSSKTLNVTATAGKVDVTAEYDNTLIKTWSSLYHTEADARTDGKFDNGGTATFQQDAENKYTMVVLDLMTPGDVAKFKIKVTDLSNVAVKYRVRMVSVKGDRDVDLTPALTITANIGGTDYAVTGTETATTWHEVDYPNGAIDDIWVTVEFPNTSNDLSADNPDNVYQDAQAKIAFVVEAVQGNAQV